MNVPLRRFLGTVAAVVLVQSWLPAQDVAVLVDVSGSLTQNQQSPYNEQFRDQVASLLLGQGVNHNLWTVTAPEPIPSTLQTFLNGGTLVAPKSSVLVVRFGTLQRAKYPALPYFDSSKVDDPQSSSFRAELVSALPQDARQGRTNKDLAQAAAARYWYDHGSQGWFMVTVSDFNQDADVLNLPEQELVDQFNTGRLGTRTPPIVLRWRADPRVQVRVEFDGRSTKAPPPAPQPRVLALTKPKNGESIPNGVAPTFSWTWNAPGDRPEERVERFTVVVTPRSGQPPSRWEVKSGPVIAKPLPPGDYGWDVIATFAATEGGTRLPPLVSAPGGFHVEHGATGWVWFVLGLIALIGGSIWFKKWRERRSKTT